MKTPITDAINGERYSHHSEAYSALLEAARKLELDRSALMEALEDAQKAISVRAKSSLLFRGLEKRVDAVLSAARANFPDPS